MKRIIVSMRWLAKVWSVILALGIMALSPGCQTIKASHLNYQESRSGDYRDTLEHWTAKAGVYRGFETMLIAQGTYKSPEFRQAYVKKYAKDYHLTAEEEAAMLKAERGMAEDEVEILLTVYASEREKLRLSAKDSLWKIFLEGTGTGPVKPFEVRSLEKKRAALEEFYPYITPWVEIYQLRFKARPSAEETERLQLVLTGVLGTARLSF